MNEREQGRCRYGMVAGNQHSDDCETRLTAEQFFATFTGREYDGHYGELDVFAFAEAYHRYAKEKERNNGAS